MTSVSEVDWKIAPRFCSATAYCRRIGDVAIMRDCKTTAGEIGKERLHIAHTFASGRRIAIVADGALPRQAGDDLWFCEIIANQPDMTLGMEGRTIIADDAGRFLPAMLQRVEAERGNRGGVAMAIDAKDAAFLVKLVVVHRVSLSARDRARI